MKIVVGLGNPGRRYAHTRHNIGYMVIDKFADVRGFSFSRRKFKSEIASGLVGGGEIILVKPQTFMNSSGEAVGPLVRFYNLPLSNILVIYDDIDLPFGKIRLRPAGTSGGHKGMNSIITHLGSEEFPRLRIGIRGDWSFGELRDYVLSRFTPEEEAELDGVIERGCNAIEAVLSGPFEMAMSRFN